jgi:hypothetical protein
MVALSERVVINGVETPVEVTERAREALVYVGYNEQELIERHAKCDWGEVSERDKELNRRAQIAGGTIVSSYRLAGDCVLWVVTSSDQSKTIVLTPSEATRYSSLF